MKRLLTEWKRFLNENEEDTNIYLKMAKSKVASPEWQYYKIYSIETERHPHEDEYRVQAKFLKKTPPARVKGILYHVAPYEGVKFLITYDSDNKSYEIKFGNITKTASIKNIEEVFKEAAKEYLSNNDLDSGVEQWQSSGQYEPYSEEEYEPEGSESGMDEPSSVDIKYYGVRR